MANSSSRVRRGFAGDCALAIGISCGLISANCHGQTFSLLGQTINAYAGSSGTAAYTGNGGLATAATLYKPTSIAFDYAGNSYIADTANNAVRKVTTAGYISTYAGTGTAGYTGDGGQAASATLNQPWGLAFDGYGNLYIGDAGNSVVRKVTPAGFISTYAGTGSWGYSGDGGPATSATLTTPYGLAVDTNGDLYIADGQNNVIRMVTPGGTISTYAGNHSSGYGGDGGPATSARIYFPKGIGMDGSGNLYIADKNNNRVRIVTPGGTISTFAGNGGTDSGDGGLASWSGVGAPQSITADAAGNVYIAEPARVRWVSTAGIISTIAGTGTAGSTGNGGAATLATLSSLSAVALDAHRQLYVSDTTNAVVREIVLNTNFPKTSVGQSSSGQILQFVVNTASTIASIAVPSSYPDFTVGSVSGCIVDGLTVNGPGTVCTFTVTFTPQYAGPRTAPLTVTTASGTNTTFGLTGMGSGAVLAFIPGIISTIAGTGTPGSSGDGGAAASAQLNYPAATAVGADGSVYLSNYLGCSIRKIDSSGKISTLAGNGTCAYSGDGGLATSAQVSYPEGLTLDAAGQLYFSDNGNKRIRKIDSNGIITTFAGTGTAGSSGDGGPATSATLTNPGGVAMDGNGNLYISDGQANRVRIVYPSGFIDTFAGNGVAGSNGDGGLATAANLYVPVGIAVDSAGKVYLADSVNNKVRVVDTVGVITTFAGNGTAGFSGDGGAAASAGLNSVHGLALDAADNLYIADNNNQVIRMVNGAGTIQTVAGTGSAAFSGDLGPATLAGLYLYNSGAVYKQSQGLSIGNGGAIYIPDMNNQRVRIINAQQTATLLFPSTPDDTTSAPQAVNILNSGNVSLNFSSFTATSGYVLQAGTCSVSTPLAAGHECGLNLLFEPIAGTGTLTGTASVADNAPSSPHTISATGTSTLYPATCSVSASPSPATYADNVMLTGTVSTATGGTPIGAVTFLDGATTLGAGALDLSALSSWSTSTLHPGNHAFTITYPGDPAFSSCASSVFLETVVGATPTITWNAPAAITYGTAISSSQLNASSGGIPGSFVYVPASGTVLNAGVNQTLSVVFTPTDTTDYTTANQATIVTVNQAWSQVMLATSSTPANYGATVTFSATLPSAATGIVTFKDGSLTLGTGGITSSSAAFATSSLPVGVHSITGIWLGDNNYTGSTSAALSEVIIRTPVSITWSAAPNPSTFGDPVSLSLQFTGLAAVPTGTATLSEGATPLGSVTLNASGAVVYTLQNAAAGNHTLTIVYNGDANYY